MFSTVKLITFSLCSADFSSLLSLSYLLHSTSTGGSHSLHLPVACLLPILCSVLLNSVYPNLRRVMTSSSFLLQPTAPSFPTRLHCTSVFLSHLYSNIPAKPFAFVFWWLSFLLLSLVGNCSVCDLSAYFASMSASSLPSTAARAGTHRKQTVLPLFWRSYSIWWISMIRSCLHDFMVLTLLRAAQLSDAVRPCCRPLTMSVIAGVHLCAVMPELLLTS